MMRQPTFEEVATAEGSVPADAEAAFALHGDFVWRVLQRLGVREADLEDMTQEVFVVVHRQIGAFDGRSRMTTWLYGIAFRVASTQRRRAWVRREQSTAEIPDAPAIGADPEEQLSDAQERQKLAEVLDLMTMEKRALFVMFELDEMSCEDIARVMEIPVGTVHSRLHHAREDFRGALKRWQARQHGGGRRWSLGRRS